VKGNTVLFGLLATTAILVLSATTAHAGNGGLPSALTSFFACYSINGKDSGQTVDIENALESPIATPNRTGVRIGSGTLACTIIRMMVPSNAKTQFLAEPNPTQALGFNAIKCYTVTGPGGTLFQGTTGTFTFEDTIFGTLGTLPFLSNGSPSPRPGSLGSEVGLTVSQLKYICGPAIVE